MLVGALLEVQRQRVGDDTIGRGLVGGEIRQRDHIPQLQTAVGGDGDTGTAAVETCLRQGGGCCVACGGGGGDGGVMAHLEALTDKGDLGRRDSDAGDVAAGQGDADDK